MVVEHKHKIGFKGTILIEPKPFEPTKHQYDRDVAAVYAFLLKQWSGEGSEGQHRGQPRHAGRPGFRARNDRGRCLRHLRFARHQPRRSAQRLGYRPVPQQRPGPGSGNAGDRQGGGLGTGGCNFDAKLRRQSIDPKDLYIAHIAGIDTLARALLAAEVIIKRRRLDKLREERYAGWNGELGKKIEAGGFTLETLADYAVKTTSIRNPSRASRNFTKASSPAPASSEQRNAIDGHPRPFNPGEGGHIFLSCTRAEVAQIVISRKRSA